MLENAYEKKIIMDSKKNTWLFYPTPSGKTGYIVNRTRGERETGHLIMDETVIEYDIIIDERDDIHVVALTAGQKVIYSRYDFKGWVKYTLYNFAGKPVNISNLQVMKSSSGLHLFYMYSEEGGGCALFHHQWTGSEWIGYRVFDEPGKNKYICYDADAEGDNRLRIAAIKGKTLLLWDFDGIGWTLSTTKDNSTWEKTTYMEFRGNSVMLRNDEGVFFVRDVNQIDVAHPRLVIEDRHVEEGPVLVSRRNTIYIAWIEAGSLGYRTSYDEGNNWGQVKYYHHTRGKELEIYGFDSTYSLLLNAKRLIATSAPDIHIPFLHRSVERIKLAMTLPECGKGKSYRPRQHTCPMDGENGVPAQEYDETHGSEIYGRDNGGKSQPTKNYEIEELKAEIDDIKQGTKDRLDRLDAQITELRKKLEVLERVNREPKISTGSVITQDMINKYMRRR